ncbi:MAG: hypothetical protein LBH29_06530 [Elusimicrobiota bacterium]|jgi:hypothetical protein|nr:hypothetical protein [Elusimicrobiota bacterium]
MVVTEELVEFITKELLKRLQSGELSGNKCCSQSVSSQPCGQSAPIYSNTQGKVKKRVISVLDIQNACPASGGAGQSFSVASSDIITPLAMDYILKMRINVIKT